MLHPSGCDENRATRSCRRVCRKLALVTLLAIALRIAVRVYYCPCPDGPSSKPRRGEEVAPSSALRRLEQPCADSPTFVTYGVGGGALRTSLGGGKLWDHSDVRSALRVMYSSLVRSFGCSPTLHMHTTMSPETARTRYLPPTTTMGSRISGRSVVFHRMNASFMENPFAVNAFNTWLALSRSKLDTFELHLRDGASTVWIDLDTVVLDKIAVNATAPWVYAYHHGRKEDIHKSKNFVYGDMWSLATGGEWGGDRIRGAVRQEELAREERRVEGAAGVRPAGILSLASQGGPEQSRRGAGSASRKRFWVRLFRESASLAGELGEEDSRLGRGGCRPGVRGGWVRPTEEGGQHIFHKHHVQAGCARHLAVWPECSFDAYIALDHIYGISSPIDGSFVLALCRLQGELASARVVALLRVWVGQLQSSAPDTFSPEVCSVERLLELGRSGAAHATEVPSLRILQILLHAKLVGVLQIIFPKGNDPLLPPSKVSEDDILLGPPVRIPAAPARRREHGVVHAVVHRVAVLPFRSVRHDPVPPPAADEVSDPLLGRRVEVPVDEPVIPPREVLASESHLAFDRAELPSPRRRDRDGQPLEPPRSPA
ncbi:hypothetical protein THAOC_04192, partial [Thalassiosira oceanica]